MTDVQKIFEDTEYALKKLKNSCVETIKDRDRMSKEMFEIYKKKGKDEVSLTALRLTYNALNILEIRFPQQVREQNLI